MVATQTTLADRPPGVRVANSEELFDHVVSLLDKALALGVPGPTVHDCDLPGPLLHNAVNDFIHELSPIV